MQSSDLDDARNQVEGVVFSDVWTRTWTQVQDQVWNRVRDLIYDNIYTRAVTVFRSLDGD